MPASPHLAAIQPSLTWMTAVAPPCNPCLCSHPPTPASAPHVPPLGPTKVLATAHRTWNNLALLTVPPPQTHPSAPSPGARMQAQWPPPPTLMVGAPSPATAGPVCGAVFSQIPKCLSPSPPQASAHMSLHPDHTVKIVHLRQGRVGTR